MITRREHPTDRATRWGLSLVAAAVAVTVLAIGIVLGSRAWSAIRFAGTSLFTGLDGDPVLPSFGAWPFIFGTLFSSTIVLVLAVVPLAGITIYVIQQGAPAVSWDFLTQVPKGSDDLTSGIGPALQGTLVLTLLAAAIGVPLGVAAGAWVAEYGRNKWGDAFGPRLLGLSRGDVRERVEESLVRAAIWEETKDRLKAPALDLSGGQQQRLCIARALAVEPDVLLLDEPTSALDPIATAKIEDLLDELKKDVTVIIVTHNMQQAARASDNTAYFLNGDLIEHGPTKDLFENPKDERTEAYITGRFG